MVVISATGRTQIFIFIVYLLTRNLVVSTPISPPKPMWSHQNSAKDVFGRLFSVGLNYPFIKAKFKVYICQTYRVKCPIAGSSLNRVRSTKTWISYKPDIFMLLHNHHIKISNVLPPSENKVRIPWIPMSGNIVGTSQYDALLWWNMCCLQPRCTKWGQSKI